MELYTKINPVDFIVLILLLIFVVKGLIKGLSGEVVGILGLVLGYFVAWKYSSFVASFVVRWVTVSKTIAVFISFIVLFAMVLMFSALVGRLLKKTIQLAELSFLDRIAGAFVGVLKVFVILMVLYSILLMLPFDLLKVDVLSRSYSLKVAKWGWDNFGRKVLSYTGVKLDLDAKGQTRMESP